MKVYITGISGTGKSTISDELKKMGYFTIVTDEIDGLCSWFNIETDERFATWAESNQVFSEKHRWLCDSDSLKRLIDMEESPIFVLGISSNQNDFLHFFDKILLLQCDPQVFIERLKSRTNNEFGKDKSVQDYLLESYQDFEDKLLKKGAISIDVNRSINQVVDEVIRLTKT